MYGLLYLYAHEKIHPEVDIGKSKFFHYNQNGPLSDIPHNVCTYKYHQTAIVLFALNYGGLNCWPHEQFTHTMAVLTESRNI